MNAGRSCIYADPRATSTIRNVVTIYVPPIQKQLVPHPSSNESQFYQQVIANKISGCLDSDFWGSLVLQLSESEPVIRHAVRAISAAYREMDTATPKRLLSRDIPASSIALEESAKAMRCLHQYIQTDQSSTLIPLIACLLFVCLEFLRGTVDTAMVHILSGIKILHSSRQKLIVENGQHLFGGIDQKMVNELVTPAFARLEVLCILFGQDIPSAQLGPPNQISASFACLSDARRQLFELSARILRFIAGVHAGGALNITPTDTAKKRILLHELQQWHDGLNELALSLVYSSDPRNDDAINIMRIHHRVIFLWLSCGTSIEECLHDKQTADYEVILSCASKLISSNSSERTPDSPEKFSFEMKIIAPLYYTAIKCRIRRIRMRAIQLLELAPRREGLWNAHIATKYAKRVIELEEKSLPSYLEDGLFDFYRSDDGPLPPESARIHDICELPGEFSQLHEIMAPNTVLPDHVDLIFRSKPWGLDREWHEHLERIEL